MTFRLEPRGEDTEVVIEEDAAVGLARMIPKPVRDPLLTWRNSETLRRLALLAERRAAPL